jgi:hypothetical protein
MSSPSPDFPLPMSAPVEQVFPTLTPEQIARVAAHGRVRPVRAGEVLLSAGDRVVGGRPRSRALAALAQAASARNEPHRGDVRRGNVKRVASAVGEGSIAITFVHQILHE